MAVKIQTFGFDEAINKAKQSKGTTNDDIILRRLQYIGEYLNGHYRTVTPGHDSGGYDDHSGNLRHSNGFQIYKDGELVYESVKLEGHTSRKKDVPTVTEAEIKASLGNYASACDIGKGWTLVLVAGMNYAKYVEAKGYNVLHLTAVEMQRKVGELKKELGL